MECIHKLLVRQSMSCIELGGSVVCRLSPTHVNALSRIFARHADFVFVTFNVFRDRQIASKAQIYPRRRRTSTEPRIRGLRIETKIPSSLLRYGVSILTGTSP
jgi:hypothetical protein